MTIGRIRVPVKRTLSSMRVKNFKAVHDSGVLKLGDLTVFIGDNGVGKSSMIEALRFSADLARGTLDDAVAPFGGFEHMRWKGGKKAGRTKKKEEEYQAYHGMEIVLAGTVRSARVRATTRLMDRNLNEVSFESESLSVGDDRWSRVAEGTVEGPGGTKRKLPANRSIFNETSWFDRWQFLNMEPDRMGQPVLHRQTSAATRLAPDGSNLGAYLFDLRKRSLDAFEGLLEALRVVLPYATDLAPKITHLFERRVAIWMKEGDFEVPGWMLSTGTLRVLALLALLRHPDPPPLICVEEIENSLDPRTVHFVVDEILGVVKDGRTQIMLTTHSPYLLDLLPLESLVLVSREPGQPPEFRRPADSKSVQEWAEDFAPGRLYTMGNLHRREP